MFTVLVKISAQLIRKAQKIQILFTFRKTDKYDHYKNVFYILPDIILKYAAVDIAAPDHLFVISDSVVVDVYIFCGLGNGNNLVV